jgi:acyl transferase domain-containing protein/thioesterase domain-containing protein
MGELQVEEIAIVGMSGAFPGAETIHEFWDNLLSKKECISTLTNEELTRAGVLPSEYQNPNYVRRGGFLKNAGCFDNEFFKISPREAEIMDPQHRVLLQQSWLVLEDAGYIPDEVQVPVGVFVGSSVNRYLESKDQWTYTPAAGDYQVMLANEKDFLATRISYKLNLKGPSVNVQSACSTSLLAVGLACKSLLNYECDMAIAGGATVTAPRKRGYTYREGMIYSKTGQCRPFDSNADGTVFSEGVGVVCLKRVSEALKDKDNIYAIIKSVGINNDGNDKIGFTAPSIDGQINAVRFAHALADLYPSDIGFVETHGTGTLLGDSVEIAALKEAFANETDFQSRCYLGTLKANLGHLDAAAGVAGLIKTALIVKNGLIPPAINFNEPNSDSGLKDSPFKINDEIVRWKHNSKKRLAGVSSFGLGGTNVHAILEQPPQVEHVAEDRSQAVLLSARSSDELEIYKKRLQRNLIEENESSFNDIAYTLRECRKPFQKRWGCVARSKEELIEKLELEHADHGRAAGKKIVFLFPGQGVQYAGMAAPLYGNCPTFSQWIDQGLTVAQPLFKEPLTQFLLHNGNDKLFRDARYSDPLLFIFEFALAQELLELGIKPDRLCGHGLGEYVAACIADVLSFEDTLHLIIKRSELIHKTPQGAMLAVSLSKDKLQPLLPENIWVSALNSNRQIVVTGETSSIVAFEQTLNDNKVEYEWINSNHACHSPLMDGIVSNYAENLKGLSFHDISTPLMSSLSGTWVDKKIDWKGHWVDHLKSPVHFYDCLKTLCKDESIFVEVGPRIELTGFVKSYDINRLSTSFPCQISHEGVIEKTLQNTLVTLWHRGLEINWRAWAPSNAWRVPLPGYPLKKTSFWILAEGKTIGSDSSPMNSSKTHQTTLQTKDPIRDIVTQVWRDIFRIDDLTLDQDFFSLGGDSLMGLGLVEEINSRLKLKLTFGELVLHPTLGALIQYICACSENQQPQYQFSILFPVQPEGKRPPLFLVAGAHTNRYFDIENMKSSYEEDFLSYFSMLVGSLGMDQPVYGFRPKGLLLDEKPHPNVRVMASHYIRALKKIQPQGPYFIGGECIGGVVAYEMAVQLQKSGDQVAQLIMMDTPRSTFLFQLKEEYRILKIHIKKGIKDALSYMRTTDRRYWKKDTMPWISLLLSVVLPITKNQRIKRRVVIGSYQYLRKLMSYRPKGYQGKVTFIVNEEWHKDRFLLGWREELGNRVNIQVVPGAHLERIRVNGDLSGRILRNTIDQALVEIDMPIYKACKN